MEIALTWNLVVLSSFILLFAYNFLLGQNGTIKLILSIYIAILTADGFAGLIKRFILDPSPGFQALFGDKELVIFVWLRIILFLLAVVVFTVKSGFHIVLEHHEKWSVRFLLHALFSFLSSALFLSTILIYFAGNSFVEGLINAQGIEIYEQSLLAQILIDYYQLWFSLPAMSFLLTSFFFEKDEED